MRKRIIYAFFLVTILFNQTLSTIDYAEAEDNFFYTPVSDTYPFDGYGHHPTNPDYNQIHEDLMRIAPSAGNESDDWIARADEKSPRELSNIVCAADYQPYDEQSLSDYNWIWGQFVTHDIDFTLTQNGRVEGIPEKINIPIPQGDIWLDPFNVGTLMIPMVRSLYNTSTGDETTPREFPNSITGWLDGSHVYGSNEANSKWLRSFENGKLKTSDSNTGEFLPIAADDDELAPSVSFVGFSASERFVAGDPRANEHAALTAMHVLFVREHNRIAEEIHEDNPSLGDEEIFEIARKINTAQMQYITYYEYLPSLGINLPQYQGFDESIDPRISNGFATIAFRMGHSQITNLTVRLGPGYEAMDIAENITMADGFWDPGRMLGEGGISPVLRGAAVTTQAANDIYYVHDLRNSMFGDPGFGGLDMCAIDIQRGRDHGVADYNSYRQALGLDPVTNWSEVSSDPEVVARLNQAYPDVNNADPILPMYAEDHISQSVLGETMHALISDQYQRLRDGDRLYFENDPELTPYMDQIMGSKLSQIILRNTDISLIQCDVMFSVSEVDEMDCFRMNENKYIFNIQYPEESIITPYEAVLQPNIVNKTLESGLGSIDVARDIMWSAYGPSLSVGDCDGDGYDDLWIGPNFDHLGLETGQAISNSETYLMKNMQDGTFTDITVESGLKFYNSTILGASWADYDNDGDLDIYHSNYGFTIDDAQKEDRKNSLYQNQGDCKFIDVTESLGLGNDGYSSTSAWGDYDNDGDLDLYSMNAGIVDEGEHTVVANTDIFYRNMLVENGEPYFIDYSTEAGGIYGGYEPPSEEDTVGIGKKYSYQTTSSLNPSATASVLPSLDFDNYSSEDWLKGTGITWSGLFADIDSDGWDDIYAATDFGISPMYKNEGDSTFKTATQESGLDTPGTAMGIDAADIDGDLDLDICMSNYGPNYVFVQQGQMQFTEQSAYVGMNTGFSSQSVSWDCNFLDIDLDGDLDLWFASGNINPFTTFSPNSIYLNNGDGVFDEVDSDTSASHPIGKTMGSIWCDFDLDGDLDLVTSDSNYGVQYFENDIAQQSGVNWIGIDVWQYNQSGMSNTTAVGAMVDVYFSNNKSVRQIVKIGSGYSGSKDTTITIGVPDGETIEKLEIRWKDGSTITVDEPEINRYHSFSQAVSYDEPSSSQESDDSQINISLVAGFILLIVGVIIVARRIEQ